MTVFNWNKFSLLHSRSWSIRAWLMLLACLSFLPFASVSFWQLNVSQVALRDTSYASLQLVHSNIEANLKAEILGLSDLIKDTATEIQTSDGNIQHKFNPQQFIHLHTQLSNMAVHDSNGDLLYSYAPLRVDVNSIRASLQQIKNSHGYVLSPVYLEQANNRPAIMMTQAIVNNKRLTYFVSFSIDLFELNKHLFHSIPTKYEVSIIDEQGIIVLHSRQDRSSIGKPAVNYIHTVLNQKVNRVVALQNSDGREMIYVQGWLPQFSWHLMSGQSASEMTGFMKENFVLGSLYFMLCLFLALFIGWRFSDIIAKPIRRLASSAQAIAVGQSQTLQISGPSEIREVAARLNAMLIELEQKRTLHDVITRHYANILESARDSLLLIDKNRNIVEVNPAALSMYAYDSDRLRRMNIRDLFFDGTRDTQWSAWLAVSESKASLFEAEHQDSQGQHFSVEISSNPLDIEGESYHQCFIRDIRQRKLLELSLLHRSRALEALNACTQAISKANSVETLLTDICSILIERTGYHMAWVGAAEMNIEKSVRPLASAGDHRHYVSTLGLTWADNEAGRGPTGRAIRTGKTVIARNIENDPDFNRWRVAAKENGFNASIALPLVVNKINFGALSIYAADGSSFSDDEVALLEEMTAEIKLPPAKPEVYCWGASKALVTRDPPKGGYSPNFIWS